MMLTSSRNMFFYHVFPYRFGQNLPHKFSNAQISRHCNNPKRADIAAIAAPVTPAWRRAAGSSSDDGP